MDEEIPAATGATYVLAAADAGYTIRVRVSFTDDDGFAENRDSASTTVVPPGVADTSGIATVAADWTLIPPESNIGPGGRFRLMFVTGDPKATGDAREPFERIDATFTDINIYNDVVQVAAPDGHAAIRNYAGHFRALASTAAVNARTNTATAASDTDTRIYWLGHRGSVDDSITDFYNGTRWKKMGIQQDEDGNEVRMGLNDFVWTGTNQNGTTSSAPLGSANPTVAEPNRNFGQMNNNETKANTNEYPLYALSMVFEVKQAGSGRGPPGGGVALAAKADRRSAVPDGNDGDAADLDGAAAAVSATARGRTVEILFDAPLDATARPAPGDFAVEADSALRAIVSVRVGPDRVVLELATPLAVDRLAATDHQTGDVPGIGINSTLPGTGTPSVVVRVPERTRLDWRTLRTRRLPSGELHLARRKSPWSNSASMGSSWPSRRAASTAWRYQAIENAKLPVRTTISLFSCLMRRLSDSIASRLPRFSSSSRLSDRRSSSRSEMSDSSLLTASRLERMDELLLRRSVSEA